MASAGTKEQNAERGLPGLADPEVDWFTSKCCPGWQASGTVIGSGWVVSWLLWSQPLLPSALLLWFEGAALHELLGFLLTATPRGVFIRRHQELLEQETPGDVVMRAAVVRDQQDVNGRCC